MISAEARPSLRLPLLAATVSALALAGCAKKPPPYVPPPPVVETVMPLPPNGAAPDMDLPDKDETGKYLTPNRNMAGQQALWHVRMALNVAALGCRQPGEPVKVQYNQMLHIHTLALKLANDATENQYKARYGVNAFMMREKTNTIVYNFFALPPAQKAFCETALAVVTTMNGLTPQALIDYAPNALQQLEKPFQDFWEAYADYLRRLEEWRRRYGRPTVKVEGWNDDSQAPPAPPPPAAPTIDMPSALPGGLPPQAPSKLDQLDEPSSGPPPPAPLPPGSQP